MPLLCIGADLTSLESHAGLCEKWERFANRFAATSCRSSFRLHYLLLHYPLAHILKCHDALQMGVSYRLQDISCIAEERYSLPASVSSKRQDGRVFEVFLTYRLFKGNSAPLKTTRQPFSV